RVDVEAVPGGDAPVLLRSEAVAVVQLDPQHAGLLGELHDLIGEPVAVEVDELYQAARGGEDDAAAATGDTHVGADAAPGRAGVVARDHVAADRVVEHAAQDVGAETELVAAPARARPQDGLAELVTEVQPDEDALARDRLDVVGQTVAVHVDEVHV